MLLRAQPYRSGRIRMLMYDNTVLGMLTSRLRLPILGKRLPAARALVHDAPTLPHVLGGLNLRSASDHHPSLLLGRRESKRHPWYFADCTLYVPLSIAAISRMPCMHSFEHRPRAESIAVARSGFSTRTSPYYRARRSSYRRRGLQALGD